MAICALCNKPKGSYDYEYTVQYQASLDTPKKKVTICYTCLNIKTKHCGICGVNAATTCYEYYAKELMVSNKWSKELVCPEHADINPSYKKVLGTGRAETYLGFIGKPLDNLYIGVEIEVEVEPSGSGKKSFENTKNELFDLFDNFVIMKTDGSLTGYGIEIVSAPAPFDVHSAAWNKFLLSCPEHVCSNTRPKGGTTECGMHIHFSRKALTVIEIGKVAYFISAASNAKLITDIAGRYNNRYCAINPVNKENYKTFTKSSNVRRSAVNNTNENTVELRIFKGTLNPVLFMKNIEFTHALVTFAKSSDIEQMTTKDFAMYVGLNGGIYPNLCKFLVWKGYLEGDKENDKVFTQK